MRFPFRSKKPKGRYSLIDPDISDSGTDDEAVVFQKKTGHIELNLIPKSSPEKVTTKVNQLKHACICLAVVVTICSVISLALFFGKYFITDHPKSNFFRTNTSSASPSNKPVINTSSHTSAHSEETATETVLKKQTPNWKKTFKHSGGEGGLRLFDVDGDGADDIIFGTAGSDVMNDVLDVVGNKFNDLHRYCKVKGLEYPCVASMVALRGYDGQELWRFNTRSEAFLTVCDVDLNRDSLLDCIATGRQAQITAFDPRKGEVLWTAEDDSFIAANWNIYQALTLQDWDADGVKDILILNGGDPLKDPEDHDRPAGRAIMLSGATGIPLGTRYLEMPNNKESYMSPALYTPPDGSTPYVLFGSGGETVPGDLLALSVEDLCSYIMENNTDNCPHFEGQAFWGEMDKDPAGFIQIYKGKTKGVMVPPAMVDVNKDGVTDLVLSAFDGAVICFDGKSFSQVWVAHFNGMESYSAPAPGYFDDDDTLDFMVHWCTGAWDKYTGSNATVISGKDGLTLWTSDSAFMQMTSDLSLKTSMPNRDMFLFRVQGRESKFRWDKEGKITRYDRKRRKRHGGDSFKSSNSNDTIEELLLSNHSMEEALRESYEQHHLSCFDDLTSYRGEVFLMDGTIARNPVKVLDMPSEKYYYDLPDVDRDKEKEKIMRQLYPDKYKDIPISGGKTHMSGTFISDDDDDDDTGAPGNALSHDEKSRKRRHLEDTDDEDNKPQKLCTVAYYDARTTGAVGDLDGDGTLDYVSVLALMIPLNDQGYSYLSIDYGTVIEKVNLETGVMNGSLKSVPVSAETDLKDSQNGPKFERAQKLFKPLGEQTWTAFMGKKGNSIY